MRVCRTGNLFVIFIGTLCSMVFGSASATSSSLPGPERFWKAEAGLHVNVDESCGLHMQGTASGGWNVARGVIRDTAGAGNDGRRLVVPVTVNSISDYRYWPRLIVQVVGKNGHVSSSRGGQYSPYRRAKELRQNLYVDIGDADFDRLEVLLSKETRVPMTVDICIGAPHFERVAGSSHLVADQISLNEPATLVEQVNASDDFWRSSPLFQKLLADKETACSRIATRKLTTTADQIRYDADLLEDASFLFQVTGGKKYSSCALRLIQNIHVAWPELLTPDLPHAHVLRAFTRADDWLGSSMPGHDRVALIGDIAALVSLIDGALEDPGTWWRHEYASNYKHAFTSAMGIACQRYAFEGHADCRRRGLDEMSLVLAALPDDGSSIEGPGYWNYSLVWIISYLQSLDASQRNKLIERSRFLQNASRFRLHVSVPGFQQVIPYGDTEPWEYRRAGTALRGLGSIQHDPIAVELAQRVTDARWPQVDLTWRDIAWTKPGEKPNVIGKEPTYAYLPDQGIVVWRSSWTADGASLVLFKAGALQGAKLRSIGAVYGGHNHPDQGGVLLYSAGQWILKDDGYTKNKATSSHNSIDFSGHGQLGEGSPWFDTGQIAPATLPTLQIVKLGEDGLSVRASLESAYPSAANLAVWTRHISMERGAPLEILDSITMAKNGRAVLAFHSDEPILSKGKSRCIGGNWRMTNVIRKDHQDQAGSLQWTSDGSQTRGVIELEAGRLVTITSTLQDIPAGCRA